jgi:hypothetical protein
VRDYLAELQLQPLLQEQLGAQAQASPQAHAAAVALEQPQVRFWHAQGFWFDDFGLGWFMMGLL